MNSFIWRRQNLCQVLRSMPTARFQTKKKALHFIWMNYLWKKINLNVVHMFTNQRKSYLMIARDDLFGWVEATALGKTDSVNVTDFLWKDIICRHECFDKLIVDEKPENRDWVIKLTENWSMDIKLTEYSICLLLYELIDQLCESVMDGLFISCFAAVSQFFR